MANTTNVIRFSIPFSFRIDSYFPNSLEHAHRFRSSFCIRSSRFCARFTYFSTGIEHTVNLPNKFIRKTKLKLLTPGKPFTNKYRQYDYYNSFFLPFRLHSLIRITLYIYISLFLDIVSIC